MRTVLILLLALVTNDPREIAKINALKKEAERAYLNGDYELAISKYSYLTDTLQITDDEVLLNLGHAYYQKGDTTGAKYNYGKVGSSSDKRLKSIAHQQLGVMSKEAGKLDQSLLQLKSAIKSDPTNRDAVYDYEVVKKLLEEQQQQQQDQQNQDQQDQDQQEKEDQDKENQDQNQEGDQENKDQQGENQEQQDQEQQEGEQQEQEQQEGEQQEQEQEKSQEQMTKEKLQEMGISEEKARQLLEAMRQSEIKYLQNQKRKATKRPPSGKPDW